ncbi:hypothetical protein VP01_3223g1 [Puccinia sorghi]|uniref:Uncharacterized protein n=1 Tax=Puccinia sorghi TaxID=27349 RepID=A0A0L6V051_9BASI|nr:hypothetical protein VP01_3223g1 [Puccinia sorghi]
MEKGETHVSSQWEEFKVLFPCGEEQDNGVEGVKKWWWIGVDMEIFRLRLEDFHHCKNPTSCHIGERKSCRLRSRNQWISKGWQVNRERKSVWWGRQDIFGATEARRVELVEQKNMGIGSWWQQQLWWSGVVRMVRGCLWVERALYLWVVVMNQPLSQRQWSQMVVPMVVVGWTVSAQSSCWNCGSMEVRQTVKTLMASEVLDDADFFYLVSGSRLQVSLILFQDQGCKFPLSMFQDQGFKTSLFSFCLSLIPLEGSLLGEGCRAVSVGRVLLRRHEKDRVGHHKDGKNTSNGRRSIWYRQRQGVVCCSRQGGIVGGVAKRTHSVGNIVKGSGVSVIIVAEVKRVLLVMEVKESREWLSTVFKTRAVWKAKLSQ